MKCLVLPWKDSKKDFSEAIDPNKIVSEESWFWIMEYEWDHIMGLAKNFDIRIEHKKADSNSGGDYLKIYLSKKSTGFIVG